MRRRAPITIAFVFTCTCIFLAHFLPKLRRTETYNLHQKEKHSSSYIWSSEQNVNAQFEANVLIIFINASKKPLLQDKFRTAVNSVLRFSSTSITFYIIGDKESLVVATKILKDLRNAAEKYQIVPLDIGLLTTYLTNETRSTVNAMQLYFGGKSDDRFHHPVFHLSTVIHKILPEIHRIIMLDIDVKFNVDIKMLFDLYAIFPPEAVIGIGPELSPVYRNAFELLRSRNKSRVGDPLPNGLPGFNSGVVLLDIDKMRWSKLYNSLLKEKEIRQLAEKFLFQHDLGDQDFYTLVSIEHMDLFFVLPCTMNRQLCTYWKYNGYNDVFNSYFKCDGEIKVYHGNCDAKIPLLEWE